MNSNSRLKYNSRLQNANRIVIKIGSSLLSDGEKKELNIPILKKIVKEIVWLLKQDKEVIIVSSGSVASGRGIRKYIFKKKRTVLKEKAKESISIKQALSAMGQPVLMDTYRKEFGRFGFQIAQVLVTESNVHSRKEYLNLKETINSLLDWDIVIPIVNENDSVAIEELCFGDNDFLSAIILGLCKADLLIVLSSVDGFYVEEERMSLIEKIQKGHFEHAGGPVGVGRGGMITKLEAAKLAMQCGAMCVILNGKNKNIIQSFFQGKDVGTLFAGDEKVLKEHKRWILYNKRTRGTIIIDAGAEQAILSKNKSLLPAGVVSIKGKFDPGESVIIANTDGEAIATGISSFSSVDLDKVKGLKNSEIRIIMSDNFKSEVIHKDKLVPH